MLDSNHEQQQTVKWTDAVVNMLEDDLYDRANIHPDMMIVGLYWKENTNEYHITMQPDAGCEGAVIEMAITVDDGSGHYYVPTSWEERKWNSGYNKRVCYWDFKVKHELIFD